MAIQKKDGTIVTAPAELLAELDEAWADFFGRHPRTCTDFLENLIMPNDNVFQTPPITADLLLATLTKLTRTALQEWINGGTAI